MTKPKLELLPVTQIDQNMSVHDARLKLQSEHTSHALIVDTVRGARAALLSDKQLADARPDAILKNLVEHAPEPLTIRVPYDLDDVVQRHAKTLELRPNLPGILVEDGAEIKLLPRQVIIKGATHVVTRGAQFYRLEGSPLDVMFYECPIDFERKMVAYYDPNDPPRCKFKHLMVPVED
ncbi:MAG: hypothetical protein ACJ74W_24095 [Pyrinomonadaceae bacterium]